MCDCDQGVVKLSATKPFDNSISQFIGYGLRRCCRKKHKAYWIDSITNSELMMEDTASLHKLYSNHCAVGSATVGFLFAAVANLFYGEADFHF